MNKTNENGEIQTKCDFSSLTFDFLSEVTDNSVRSVCSAIKEIFIQI